MSGVQRGGAGSDLKLRQRIRRIRVYFSGPWFRLCGTSTEGPFKGGYRAISSTGFKALWRGVRGLGKGEG